MDMPEKEKQKKNGDRTISSHESNFPVDTKAKDVAGGELAGILSERIHNLEEAIRELDDALVSRKALSSKFLHQIDKEIQEVQFQLSHLNPPWKTGFHPQLEFLRHSFHKSLTSRKKEIRSEELKYWQDMIGILKEKRKLLDEYKSLLGTKKRLVE